MFCHIIPALEKLYLRKAELLSHYIKNAVTVYNFNCCVKLSRLSKDDLPLFLNGVKMTNATQPSNWP